MRSLIESSSKYHFLFFLILLLFFLRTLTLFAAEYKIKKIGEGFTHPWGISKFSSNEVLITERGGKLYKVNFITGTKNRIKNIPKVYAEGQGGLLDVLVDHISETQKNVYLCYSSLLATGSSTSLAVGIIRDNTFVSKRVLFKANNVSDSSIHFGCRIAVQGDSVYLSIGDRGERKSSQNLKSHAGSVIRINKINGSIPKNNNKKSGWLPELLTKGHRNPQGMAINQKTNQTWINEHGPKGGDEINILKAGENYGWPIVTHGEEYWGGKVGKGIKSMEGYVDPVWYWVPSIAPSGMIFYNKDMFPEFKNNLLVSSLKFRSIYLVKIKDDLPFSEKVLFKNKFGRIRDIEQLNDGSILLISDENRGGVYRIYRSSSVKPRTSTKFIKKH